MAILLNKEELVQSIYELLTESKEYIYLICPYIELHEKSPIITAIEDADSRDVDINIIYSKGFKKKAGQERLKKYSKVKLCYISDLHMKVYLSEKSAIVCTLNLHDYSINNNLECGVFMDYKEDLWKQVYTMIKTDVYKNMIVEKKRDKYTWKEQKVYK